MLKRVAALLAVAVVVATSIIPASAGIGPEEIPTVDGPAFGPTEAKPLDGPGL
jgi:hypothetical protein